MTTPSRRRLMRDFRKLQEDPPSGVTGAPTEDNILLWHAVIFGPQDTPFEDGTFKMSLEFSEEYPNKPPTVKFISKMFHPNVYADGSICLDILQNRWSPTYDVAAVLTSIQSLLDEPNPNSPANSVAAQLYQENRREYEKRVQQIVEQSWEAFNTDMDEEAVAKMDTELKEEFEHVEQEMQRQQEAAAASATTYRRGRRGSAGASAHAHAHANATAPAAPANNNNNNNNNTPGVSADPSASSNAVAAHVMAARVNTNFRTNLLDRIGGPGQRKIVVNNVATTPVPATTNTVEPSKDLEDSLSNSEEADLEKLRWFALKNVLPVEKRVFIWKLLLGVDSSTWAVKEELERHRKEEAELLLHSLQLMRKIPVRRLEGLKCTFPDIVYMIRIADPSVPYPYTKRSSRPSDLALFAIASTVSRLCNETGGADAWVDAFWLTSKVNALLHAEFGKLADLREAIRGVREQLFMLETEPCAKELSPYLDCAVMTFPECSPTTPCGEVDRESPIFFGTDMYTNEVEEDGEWTPKIRYQRSQTSALCHSNTPVSANRNLVSETQLNQKADWVDEKPYVKMTHFKGCPEAGPSSSCCDDVTGEKARERLLEKVKILEFERYAFSRSLEVSSRIESQNYGDQIGDDDAASTSQCADVGNQSEFSERDFFEESSEDTALTEHCGTTETSHEASSATEDSDASVLSDRLTNTGVHHSAPSGWESSFNRHEPPTKMSLTHKVALGMHVLPLPIVVSSPDYPGASMEVHNPDMDIKPTTSVPEQEEQSTEEAPSVSIPQRSRLLSNLDECSINQTSVISGQFSQQSSRSTSDDEDKNARTLSSGNLMTTEEIACRRIASGPRSVTGNDTDVQEEDNEENFVVSLPSLEGSSSNSNQNTVPLADEIERIAVTGFDENADQLETIHGEVDVMDFIEPEAKRSASLDHTPSPNCHDLTSPTPVNTPVPVRYDRRPKFKISPFSGLNDEHLCLWFLSAGSRYLSHETTLRLWDKLSTGENVTLLLSTVLVDLLAHALEKWAAANEDEEFKVTSVFPISRYLTQEMEMKIVANAIDYVYYDRKGPVAKSEEKEK